MYIAVDHSYALFSAPGSYILHMLAYKRECRVDISMPGVTVSGQERHRPQSFEANERCFGFLVVIVGRTE